MRGVYCFTKPAFMSHKNSIWIFLFLQYFHCSYKDDPWLWDEDWSVRYIKRKKIPPKKLKQLEVANVLLSNFCTCIWILVHRNSSVTIFPWWKLSIFAFSERNRGQYREAESNWQIVSSKTSAAHAGKTAVCFFNLFQLPRIFKMYEEFKMVLSNNAGYFLQDGMLTFVHGKENAMNIRRWTGLPNWAPSVE